MVLKKEREGVEKQFFELCSKVVNELDLELYDLEYSATKQELRVFIRNKGTGSAVIEDCMNVDRAMTPYIDELDWMPEELRLEVSSPGVFRNLTTINHLSEVVGEFVELKLIKRLDKSILEGLPQAINGEKRIRVLVKGLENDQLMVEVENFNFEIDIINIKKANLSPNM